MERNQRTELLLKSLDEKSKKWKEKPESAKQQKKAERSSRYKKTRKRFQELHKFNENMRDDFEKKKDKLWDLIESKEFSDLLSQNKTKIFVKRPKIARKLIN